MLRIFLPLLLCTFLHGEDEILLDAHIRMIPKIMALDTKIAALPSANKAVLGIIYDKPRKASAQKVAESINRLYNGKVASLSFVAIPLSSDELGERRDVTFAYLMPMSPLSTRRIGVWGALHSVPTFSYDPDALESGILGAIAIERETVIYLNKTAIKNGRFRFDDSLLQMARYVE